MIRIHDILVPTDFSEPAQAALQYAQALAQEFESRLHLLHVVPEPYVYPWGTELSSLPLGDLLTQAEEAAKERLAQLSRGMDALAGGTEFSTAIGPPVDRILDYVSQVIENFETDLAAMRRLREAIVFSTLEEVRQSYRRIFPA